MRRQWPDDERRRKARLNMPVIFPVLPRSICPAPRHYPETNDASHRRPLSESFSPPFTSHALSCPRFDTRTPVGFGTWNRARLERKPTVTPSNPWINHNSGRAFPVPQLPLTRSVLFDILLRQLLVDSSDQQVDEALRASPLRPSTRCHPSYYSHHSSTACPPPKLPQNLEPGT